MNSILNKLSSYHNQTTDMKIAINNTNAIAGQGSVFIGSFDNELRILIGAHFGSKSVSEPSTEMKIGVFGGSNEANELIIDTVIRETMEEIFNYTPTPEMVKSIRDFLNTNTDYYVHQMTSNSYSYIFDLNMLGEFIKRINAINSNVMIPIKTGLVNLNNYLVDDIFNLVGFIIDRDIVQVAAKKGLYEVKYLSLPSLKNICSTENKYSILNFNTKERQLLNYQPIFIKLKESLLTEILTISNS